MSSYFHIQVATILVENNASLKATTKNGFTPLHIAAKYGNMSVANILLQRDSKLDAQGKVCINYIFFKFFDIILYYTYIRIIYNLIQLILITLHLLFFLMFINVKM